VFRLFIMVRWQNQEDPGYATPSSSEDELEVLEYETSAKHQNKNQPRQKRDCLTDDWECKRFRGKHLDGCRKKDFKDESLWGWSEDRRGESEELRKPATPGGGVNVPKNKHMTSRSRKKQHYIAREKSNRFLKHRSEADAGRAYSPNTESRKRSQQQNNKLLAKERIRVPKWNNADSVARKKSDGFLSPSPTQNSPKKNNHLELFLSLLPWGKFLGSTKKVDKSSTFPTSKPDNLNGHGISLSPSTDGDDNYSLYSNEPREFFSPLPIIQEDQLSEERLGLNGLKKQSSSECKNDPCWQRDFTGGYEDNWKHRVLFPLEELDDHSHLSESEQN